MRLCNAYAGRRDVGLGCPLFVRSAASSELALPLSWLAPTSQAGVCSLPCSFGFADFCPPSQVGELNCEVHARG